MTERSFGFIAMEESLVFYNRKAVLNNAFVFFYDDDAETIFDFAGYASAYLKVYDERSGQLLKNFTAQITRNSNALVMNASVADMTFDDEGTYYYEMGYVGSGYEIPLKYGEFVIV